jgi:O-antigen/teichoic acid export membrane protein
MIQVPSKRNIWGFVHALGGNASVTLAQGVQFLVLARALGPTEFGHLSAIGSLVAILIPFSGMGAANVMVMRASRDPSLLPIYLGNAFVLMLATGTTLIGLMSLTATWLAPTGVSPGVLIIFGFAEMVASRFLDICWQAFLVTQELYMVSRLLLLQSATRVFAALVYVYFGSEPSAAGWVWCALMSNIAVGAVAVRVTVAKLGRPRCDLRLMARDFVLGVYFAVGLSAKGFYTDADKVLLGRFGDATSLGHYTAAYRLIQVALMPARALSTVLQNRLFRAGSFGVAASLEVAFKILGPVTVLSLATGALYYALAPLLPLLTGDSYQASVEMLQFMCLLPLVQAIQAILADVLASAGHQRLAALIQTISALSIFGIGVVLVPALGWRGAGLSSYLSQLVLCTLLGLAVFQLRRSSPGAGPASATIGHE